MKAERPLFWHQGLFLQPQHFQLDDCYSQSLLMPFQQFLVPFFWGAAEVSIQTTALGSGAFQVTGAALQFQDGTYVTLPGNAVIEARSFNDDWADGGKTFTVFIGLKKWSDSGENVAQIEPSQSLARVTTRFAAMTSDDQSPDLHGGGPTAEVRRLDYVLKLFWETEIDHLGDYMLLPIAQLARTREGIELNRKFIPPVITVGSSETLFAIIREIRDQLASRSRQLEGYKRQRGIQNAEFGARDMVYLLALRTLNRYVPIFSHYCENSKIHPWHLYGSLRQLIGELSTFSEKVTVMGESAVDNVPRIPEYDHRELGECFSAARSLIIELLDEVTAGPEYIIPLLYDGTYFASEMKPAHFESKNRYYLVFKTEEMAKEVVQTLAVGTKLSSRERLPLLIARALPGIGLEFLPVLPQELPRYSFAYYFAVDTHSEQWESVEKGRNIALYWDRAPLDLTVELMIVERS